MKNFMRFYLLIINKIEVMSKKIIRTWKKIFCMCENKNLNQSWILQKIVNPRMKI